MARSHEIEIVPHQIMHPLEVLVIEIHSRMPHGHADLEVGLLLKGSITALLDTESFFVPEGGIYLINRGQMHALSSEDDNLVIVFQVPSDVYLSLDKKLENMRVKVPLLAEGALHDEAYRLLISAARLYFSEDPYKELKCTTLVLQLLTLLLENQILFLDEHSEVGTNYLNAKRMTRITEYISEHYTEKITLRDLAEREHLSEYFISHLVSDMLRMSFQDYVTYFRFRHALAFINRRPEAKILDIALDAGFSSTRYLNKAFEKYLRIDVKGYLALSEEDRRFLLTSGTSPAAGQKPKAPAMNSTSALPTMNRERKYSYSRAQKALNA